jgi:hypothetical protein
MRDIKGRSGLTRVGLWAITLVVTALHIAPLSLAAQGVAADAQASAVVSIPGVDNSVFRAEITPVSGGAEIVTIFSRRSGENGADLPLLSVLRDTLGDDVPENDRLRYLWLHTYTRPTLTQKLSAIVPFLYTRTTNKDKVGSEPPPAVIDLHSAKSGGVWNTLFWAAFKRVLLGEVGFGVKASALQYRQNKGDQRRVAVASALSLLSVFQASTGERVLSEQELKDMQARLALTDKTFGGHLQPENLGRAYDKDLAATRDRRGHNWELLRQMAERQGLIFEPLEMPDGSARHAVLWVMQDDLATNKGKDFEARFLNIKNPWKDEKIANWGGYTETRWYDKDDREVEPETAGASKKTLIPLALYGLDHPKIPIILIDFRNNANPKTREMSRRALSDVTNSVLALSGAGGLPYFVGRYVYDWTTNRRGMDINQASRLRSYAQLKLLLSLDDSLEPEFKNELAHRVEASTLNPLENDSDVEQRIARAQYKNLMDFAADPDGLPGKLREDRRQEMVKFRHGAAAKTAFDLGHILTLGTWTHRETDTPEMLARMDVRRQLDHHERVVREIAFRTAGPEIDTDLSKLKHSLVFLSASGDAAGDKTARALGQIFAASFDDDLRSLCLAGLYKINNMTAKRELVAIYQNNKLPDHWRDTTARYLKLTIEEGLRISKRDAQTVASITASN